MKFKISHLVLVVMAALSVGLSACTEQLFVTPKVLGRVSGTVIDNKTKKPLSGVLIKLNPSGRSIQTDTSGTFSFDSLTAGKYTISAEKTGLFNEYVSVEVTDIQNPVATIYMSEDIKTNRAPTKPSKPIPAVGTRVAKVDSLLLAWTATDPDRDTLRYDVYLFEAGASPTTPYAKDYGNDTLYVSNLKYDKTYYWYVVAKDKRETVNGDIWSFTTPKFPDLSYVFARQESNGRYQIYSANNDKTVVKLTTEGSNWRPIVSPNREQIAFISNRLTNPHIYVMNRDGSNLRKVTDVPVSGLVNLDLSFTWANNGSRLIYPSNNRLYSINADGTGLREEARAPAGRQFAGADWNEALKTIITRTTGESVYDNELVLIDTKSGLQVPVLTSSRRVGNPVLSIDGGEILFSMDINDQFKNEEGRQTDARIFQLILETRNLADLSSNPSGTSNTLLKPKGTNDLNPRYSPSGQEIIFTNEVNDGTNPSLNTTDLTGSRNRSRILDNAEMGYWRRQ